MSQHDEDRDKVVNALGGKKGLIDSGVPAVVFLVVFNFTQEVNIAIWAALSLSITLAIFRLIMKENSDNFREAAILDLIKIFLDHNLEVVVFEPLAKEEIPGTIFLDSIDEFKDISSVILANRFESCLEDVAEKVITRDILC